MKTYEYNIQNCRKIIKKDYLNAESVEEAHEKLIKDLPEYIIWIGGIRFPPAVKLKKYSLRLNPRTKEQFDRIKGKDTVNHFLKTLLDLYKDRY